LASITKVTAVLYGLFLIPWIAMLFMERNKAVRPVKSKLDAILILFTCSIGSLYIFELFQHTYNLSNSLKSNLFYAFLLLTYLASTQIFFKSFIVILVQICSIACGISFAFALNFIRYSDKNHFAVVTFIDYIQRFSYSSEEQHISPVPVGTERFFVSIISKLDILWLAHYPIQILLYIAAFFIVKTYSQKKRYLPLAIFLYAIATCILVETLSRLRVIVPENHIYDRSNFDTIVYYKIYTELFIMITVVTSLNYFRTTFGYTRLLKCSLLVMTFICFASIKINIVSLKNDSLNYLSINQTTINACNHATPAKHFYTYLANGFKERTPLKIDLCYEQMDKILKRD